MKCEVGNQLDEWIDYANLILKELCTNEIRGFSW